MFPAGIALAVASQRSLFSELRRRHVLRAAVLYAGAVWAVAQGVAQLGPPLGAPEWITPWFLVASAVGFPFWLAFAWYYKFTPHGFRRESELGEEDSQRLSNARRLDFAIIGVLIVAVAFLTTGYIVHRVVPAADSGVVSAKSIAVLPFENLSADKDNEYFAAGMQDLILTKLSDIRDLKVISRSSTARYESRPADLRSVGRQLGVATVLEGSVQKVGQQVLINVQLIDVRTNAHIWAQDYTRDLDNIFGVEGDVAGQVVVALRAKLSTTESAQLASMPTTDQAAYDLFLRAEYQSGSGDLDYDIASWKAALPLYRQATERDPGFALAYARLSSVESRLAWFGGGGEDVKQLARQARTHAQHALRLSPKLAAAHVALGYSNYYGDANYAAALKAFDEALALSPSDAGALAARGYVERRQGRFDAALVSLQQALAHDPRNSVLSYDLGTTYMLVSRYADAENWLRHALELDPTNRNARIFAAKTIVLRSGDTAQALANVQGDDAHLKLTRVALLVWQRQWHAAIALLESVPDTPDHFPANGVPKILELAKLKWLAGDVESSRHLFEQSLPRLRAQLDQQQGIELASAWNNFAMAKFGLGESAEALDAISKANVIIRNAQDKLDGPAMLLGNAALFAQAGRADLAVPLLSDSLTMPGIGVAYSPVLLWLDPSWDPIREHPDFQALLQQYAKYKPAVTYDPAPAS